MPNKYFWKTANGWRRPAKKVSQGCHKKGVKDVKSSLTVGPLQEVPWLKKTASPEVTPLHLVTDWWAYRGLDPCPSHEGPSQIQCIPWSELAEAFAGTPSTLHKALFPGLLLSRLFHRHLPQECSLTNFLHGRLCPRSLYLFARATVIKDHSLSTLKNWNLFSRF